MVEAGLINYKDHRVTILQDRAGKFSCDIENHRYTDDGVCIDPDVLYGYGGFETKDDAIHHAKIWIDTLYKN